jgi:hypothetical protein
MRAVDQPTEGVKSGAVSSCNESVESRCSPGEEPARRQVGDRTAVAGLNRYDLIR